jgi:hypothetical protein
MTFLTGSVQPRTASARAVGPTELEVWHPQLLMYEYEAMPTILKYILDQSLRRLMRMNTLISKLNERREKSEALIQKKIQDTSRRQFFRKSVGLDCYFKPLQTVFQFRNSGTVTDISKGGARIEVHRTKHMALATFKPGDLFSLKIYLTPQSEFDAKAMLVFQGALKDSENIALGFSFQEMSEDCRKALSFFLK